ncbi:glycoside hydrolase family 19 protein [Piscinibacter sakaiensis]|uniref:glycoside hydrolase family 19 protein n=1 Tax=Piscinibacter sakaiensis TaxID=1547922 RepID=UPI00372AA733
MLTPALLARVLRQASSRRLDACTPPLRAAMAEFGIDTNRRRAAAFIAQLAHESGEFRWMEERWGPTAAQRRYEPPGDLARRLGNPIQLTGRANYRRCGQALGLDLEARPEQVADPAVGFRVAGWFWSHRQLNARADAGDFVGITRGINGGTNGLAERERYHALALAALAGVYPEHADDAPAGAHPPASVHAPAAGAACTARARTRSTSAT